MCAFGAHSSILAIMRSYAVARTTRKVFWNVFVRVRDTPFGAAALVMIGVGDDDSLLAASPPLFVKMQ